MNEREGKSQLLNPNSVEKSTVEKSITWSKLLMQFAALTKFVRNYEDKDTSEICTGLKKWDTCKSISLCTVWKFIRYSEMNTYQLGRNLKWVTLDWNKVYKDLHYSKVWKAALFWMHQTIKQIIVTDWKSLPCWSCYHLCQFLLLDPTAIPADT